MPTLTILFEGLCCFVDPEGQLDGVVRRAVFQDRSQHQDDPHFTYVEFYRSDFDENANGVWAPDLSDYYDRFNYTYQHVKAKNVRIALANRILSAPPLTILPSFHEMIPKLSQVSPTFLGIQSSYLLPKIGSGRVGAYFDITAGVLSAGPAEQFRTRFSPEFHWPARHLGQWAQLELQIEDESPLLLVYDLATDAPRPLVFKPGTNLITIGNQTEMDVAGIPPTEDTPGHFGMYYDLAVSVASKPLPVSDELGLGTGCIPSSWR
ncbi:MAG TPA: hypothetical protein VGQ36_29010 [Thermoanaerobaculia bacterium]|jgi:hypothetical protein|nr:hypothetical protein [Thermoanaerobaculia bacterium]